MPLNKQQQIAAKVYGGGDYSYVTSIEQVERANIGDTLFLFIMRELDESEGCNSMGEAIRRMERAQADIQVVLDGLRGIS